VGVVFLRHEVLYVILDWLIAEPTVILPAY